MTKSGGRRLAYSLRFALGGRKVFDWAVIEYPNFDSYRHKVAELEKLDWYRYWSGKTMLGTKMDINLQQSKQQASRSPSDV